MERLINFIKDFTQSSNDKWILVIVVLMIALFTIAIISLFFTALGIRIKNNRKKKRRKNRYSMWNPVLLAAMDGSLSSQEAYKSIKYVNSIDYILYLGEFLDNLKGQEKERIVLLARESEEYIIDLIRDHDHDKRMFGIHLLSTLDKDIQLAYLLFVIREGTDRELALITVREVSKSKDPRIAEVVINNLSFFKYLNPRYFCTILAENGQMVIPHIRKELLNPIHTEKELVIMIETLNRLHDQSCLDMTTYMLKSDTHPEALSAWLRYLDKVAGGEQHHFVKMMISHESEAVRIAAVKAYLTTVAHVTARDVLYFLDDDCVWVAMEAVRKVRLMSMDIPISQESLATVKHGDIYEKWEI